MFCNQCGKELQADFRVCPNCGRPIPSAPQATTDPTRLQRHLRTLGTLWAILGVLFLIPSVVMMAFGSVGSFFIPLHLGLARNFAPFAAFVAGGSLLIIGAGGILVGWGLNRREHWARSAVLIIGFLALFHPPFGTLLGIYTFWVLLSADAAQEYRCISA